MNRKIVWNCLGLGEKLSGIERLALNYCRLMRDVAPEVPQVVLVEPSYTWTNMFPDAVEQRTLTRIRPSILLPRNIQKDHRYVYHSWANTWSPLLQGYDLSMTVHDWGPYWDKSIQLRIRAYWLLAIETNLRMCHTIHVTLEELVVSAPERVQRLLATKNVVTGGAPVAPKGTVTSRRPNTCDHFILAVGQNVPRKRFAELTSTWEESAELSSKYQLVVVGEGTELLGQGRGYIGSGFVEDAELDKLLATCSAVISVSDYEGLNLPVREALERNVPTICLRSAVLGIISRDMYFIDHLSANEILRVARELTQTKGDLISFNKVSDTSPQLINNLLKRVRS